MKTDWKSLCAELYGIFEKYDDESNLAGIYWDMKIDKNDVLDRARAALAEADGPAVPSGTEPASVAWEPSDEELLATLDKATADFPPRHPKAESLNAVEYHLALELRKARAVLARWGHQPAPLPEGEQRHPEPVPVSERLPGAEDCDAEGRCWFFIDGAQWALEDRTYGCNRHRSHWLPAHALPLPAGEVK